MASLSLLEWKNVFKMFLQLLIYLYAFSDIASHYQFCKSFFFIHFLFYANSNPVYFSRSLLFTYWRWMPDPHFNAKQQAIQTKIASSKSFVSKSRGWCILRSWKKLFANVFSRVKSEKSLIVIQSNTTNDSIHPGVVATVLRFCLKCFSRGHLLKGFHHVHLHWRHPFLF